MKQRGVAVAKSGVFKFKSNNDIPELTQSFGFNADGKVKSVIVRKQGTEAVRKSSESTSIPSLAHLKDKVLRIILLQGQGKKTKKDSPEKPHSDKIRSMLEEVDQVAKAIFMTGLPKPSGQSPSRETDLRKKQLETER